MTDIVHNGTWEANITIKTFFTVEQDNVLLSHKILLIHP